MPRVTTRLKFLENSRYVIIAYLLFVGPIRHMNFEERSIRPYKYRLAQVRV